MSYQYNTGCGQEALFNRLKAAGVPNFFGRTFETHAPYDSRALIPTLLLNGLSPHYFKLPALYEVSYIRGESLELVATIEKPVERLRIGDIPTPFEAKMPIGAVNIVASQFNTSLSFLSAISNNTESVEVKGIDKEESKICTRGLLVAVEFKITGI